MSILVRNLPRTTTEDELKALFEPFGEVQSCALVLDKETGISKGFGFIDMLNQNEIDAAIEALNSSKVAGNKIRVKWSNQESFKQSQEQQAPVDGQNVWGNANKAEDEQ